MSERVPISIVLCTAGTRGAQLARGVWCANRAIEHITTEAELVIVDNSPTGVSPSLDIPAATRLVRARWPGSAHARNVGAIFARGDILVYVDDDVEYEPEWLLAMVTPIVEGRADIVASPIRLSDELALRDLPKVCREWLAENIRDESRIRLVSAGMAAHRRIFEIGVWEAALGAGPGRTGYGEEQLLHEMSLTAGMRTVYSEGPAAVHHPDPSRVATAKFIEEARKKGASDAWLAHHWRGASMRLPRLRSMVRRFRANRAIARQGEVLDGELANTLAIVKAAAFADAMVGLRGTSRRYVPRPAPQPTI